MRFSLTLGKRIASGIVLMLLLMMVVGVVGYFGLTNVIEVTEFSGKINELNRAIASAESAADRYLISLGNGDGELRESSVKEVSRQSTEGLRIINELKVQAAIGGEEIRKLDQSPKDINGFAQAFDRYKGLEEEKAQHEAAIEKAFQALLENIGKGLLRIETMTVEGNVSKASMISYIKSPTEGNWSVLVAALGKLDTAIGEWRTLVESSKELNALATEISKQYQEIKGFADNCRTINVTQAELIQTMKGHAASLDKTCADLAESGHAGMLSQARNSIRLIFGVIIFAFVVGLAYAIVSVRGTVGKLNSVVQGVTDASDRVASASSQVASSSQQLAEGASEQAASLEETSSSLEEMASMTRQNADNASQANRLIAEAGQVVEQANASMSGLTTSMGEISKASEETQKIVKTIDEIAFQTNLLALNAAVEAARAGEAGAGFAVVADEVRNLAMRAAEAAKNTARLIEGTAGKVRAGSGLVGKTNEEFQQVAVVVAKSGELVGEIAAASHEQAQGIEQINRAMAEMDKVTQQNAASAEQSSAASEEMTGLATQMRELIMGMGALVGGNGNGNGNNKAVSSRPPQNGRSMRRDRQAMIEAPAPTHRKPLPRHTGKGNDKPPTARPATKERHAEKLIPFDDDSFKDF